MSFMARFTRARCDRVFPSHVFFQRVPTRRGPRPGAAVTAGLCHASRDPELMARHANHCRPQQTCQESDSVKTGPVDLTHR